MGFIWPHWLLELLGSLKGKTSALPKQGFQAPRTRWLGAVITVLLVICCLCWLPTELSGRTGTDSSREHVLCQGVPASGMARGSREKKVASKPGRVVFPRVTGKDG